MGYQAEAGQTQECAFRARTERTPLPQNTDLVIKRIDKGFQTHWFLSLFQNFYHLHPPCPLTFFPSDPHRYQAYQPAPNTSCVQSFSFKNLQSMMINLFKYPKITFSWVPMPWTDSGLFPCKYENTVYTWHSISHCVPRAPVREVSSRVYLSAYCLNQQNTMHCVK